MDESGLCFHGLGHKFQLLLVRVDGRNTSLMVEQVNLRCPVWSPEEIQQVIGLLLRQLFLTLQLVNEGGIVLRVCSVAKTFPLKSQLEAMRWDRVQVPACLEHDPLAGHCDHHWPSRVGRDMLNQV